MASMRFLNLAFLCLFSLYKTSSAAVGGLCATSVVKHGYKCEEFKVTTDDGYILTVHRIPEGRAGGGRGGPPVLLQHGILMDGMVWVTSPPKQNLAMTLADSGFDVWISHVRGTRYSRQHLTLNSSDPEYWGWTWDEMVIHDVPTVLGLVFKETGRQIHYVGHSMGTLVALAGLSEGKLKHVKSGVMLSPIAYLHHVKAFLTLIAAKVFLGELHEKVGMADFDPTGPYAAFFAESLCHVVGVNCNEIKVTLFSGENCCLNKSVLQYFLEEGHGPQPTSIRNLVHFAQYIRHGNMWKYDYGSYVENLQHYGQMTPPLYNLSNIPTNLPLLFLYGGQDVLSDSEDVSQLINVDLKLHDKANLRKTFIHEYAHLDFVLGNNAKEKVYNEIVDFLKEFE